MPVKKTVISRKELSGVNGVRLYLRIHVMPKLNMPVRGQLWQWASALLFLAILIFLAFYFFAD